MADSKIKCVVCSSYLFEDDDVVNCPVCGAPHHRDCYRHLGHCGMEELHGTERQYTPPTAEEKSPETEKQNPLQTDHCIACGSELSGDKRFCAHCGAPAGQGQPPFAHSPFGAPRVITESTVVEEGVTAAEVAKTVHVNPLRYVAKFMQLNEKRRRSWNWAAFLMPGLWFAYRKMYKESVLSTILLIASVLCNLPFAAAISTLPVPPETVQNYMQLGQYYSGYLDQIGWLPLAVSLAGLVLSLVVRVVSSLYGDWIYKKRVMSVIGEIKKETDPQEQEYLERKLGGVSFVGMVIAALAIEFFPRVIQILIML